MFANVITHDWEFYEDGKTIRPISVGMVGIDGREYYAIFSDANYWGQKTKWLKDNVYPHIASDLMYRNEVVKDHGQIAKEVIEFIASYHKPQLWAWYGAYDHVLMAQTLGGRMVDLPDGVPMFTNDLKTLDVLVSDNSPLGVINSLPHHALSDAKYDMKLYKAFMGRLYHV